MRARDPFIVFGLFLYRPSGLFDLEGRFKFSGVDVIFIREYIESNNSRVEIQRRLRKKTAKMFLTIWETERCNASGCSGLHLPWPCLRWL